MDPNATGCDLPRGFIGHFQVVFLLRLLIRLSHRHAGMEVFFVHGEESGGGDFGEGGAVAGDGGPDCEGGEGERWGVRWEAGGEG